MIKHSILAQANDPFEPFAKKPHPVVPEFSFFGLFLIIFSLLFLVFRRKLFSRNKK